MIVIAAWLLGGCSNPMSSTPVVSPSPVTQGLPVPTATPVARRVLAPARSFPVVALCSQQLTAGQDGSSGPVFCADGSLNVMAWAFYERLSPRVLSAGSAASLQRVQSAIRRDCKVGHARASQERSAYELAASYYGWNFDTDPTNPIDAACT